MPSVLNLVHLVVALATAWFLARSGRANRLLVLGFVVMAVDGLVFNAMLVTVNRTGGIGSDSYNAMITVSQGMFLIGPVLVLLGALALASSRAPRRKRSSPAAGAYVNPSVTPMESLIIPRNATNSFTRAESLRDELYDRIEQSCRSAGIEVIGYKSPAQSGVVWARFDYVLPQATQNLSLRATLKIIVERFDYHRFEHLLTIEVSQGTKQRTVSGFIRLEHDDIAALNTYLTAGGPFPSLRSTRVRWLPFQFWRPLNKVERLRPDWLMIGAIVGLVALVLIPYVGVLLAITGTILLVRYSRQRRTYILTTGKPMHDPRELLRVDSWQVNVERLGGNHGAVRDALLERLRVTAGRGVQVEPERIWYPGIDGKVEREQIVCTFRRAMGFIHLEAYGDDLFVGWDTHVNAATWAEQTLANGVDKETGKLVVANRVVPSWQAPNEYDLTDVAFITEWIHSATSRVLKRKLEEFRIDQEIDFTIQRGSRNDVLSAADNREPAPLPGVRGALAARLRRVA